MQKITLNLPAMYADHHVLRVRQALLGLKGVQQVVASAARKQVSIVYDELATSPDALIAALAEAGYTENQSLPLPEFPKRHADGAPWHSIIPRVTKTEIKDLEMSGDFRRY